MVTGAKTAWRLVGDELKSCNCAWGCPCDFMAPPTRGQCEGFGAIRIREGHFGDVRLDGLAAAMFVHFPGAVHEGNGTLQVVIDERATPEQRDALREIFSGRHGGLFEIFAAVCPDVREPFYAPIEFEQADARHARLRIPDRFELALEPIKNPVTGEEFPAKVVLPTGFEYNEAEMANAVRNRSRLGGDLEWDYENVYGATARVDWTNG